MTALVFPRGLLVGAYHNDGDPDSDSDRGHHEVRLAGRVHDLTAAELAAWMFAHGPADGSDNDDPFTTRTLLNVMADQQVPRPAPLVDSLLRRGLLVEVTRDNDGLVAFAGAHRVVPTLHGLGNSPDEPWLYSIGLPGQARIQVSRLVFDVWAWSHLDDTLWRACELIAELEAADGDTDPATTKPVGVLTGFVSTLHGLLGAQAAYLEPAETEPAETEPQP